MSTSHRHRAALQALKATYGTTSKRIPARLLGLWWLFNDNCSEALDAVLQITSSADHPEALLTLLCQQAYGRKGHAKLTAYIRDNVSIAPDVRQVCVACTSLGTTSVRCTQGLLDTLRASAKDPLEEASPATTPAASTSTTECNDDPAAEPPCCCAGKTQSTAQSTALKNEAQRMAQNEARTQLEPLAPHTVQSAWHSAEHLLSTKVCFLSSSGHF